MKLPRNVLKGIFQQDDANVITVYCAVAFAAGDILAIKGMQGAYLSADQADASDATLSDRALVGVALYATALGDYEPVFAPLLVRTGIDTSAYSAVGDAVFLSSVTPGATATTGTFPVGVILSVHATTGSMLVCPALVEGVAAGQINITDGSNFWTTDTLQGLANELVTLLGSATSATRNYTDAAVLRDDEALHASLDKLDGTFEDVADMSWDQAALPTPGIAKGFVIGAAAELAVTQNGGGDLTVNVAAGEAWSHQGHKLPSTGIVNVTGFAIPTPASGNEVRDIVVINATSNVVRRAGVEGAVGVAVDAPLTAGDVPLARVILTEGVDVSVMTGNITDLRERQGVLNADKMLYDDDKGYYAAPAADTKSPVNDILDEIGLFAQNLTPRNVYRVFEDFEFDAGVALPLNFATSDVSGVGAPTLDFVANSDTGTFQLVLAADNEAERLTLYQGDYLSFDITQLRIFEARVRIDQAAALAAVERVVVGVGSALNAVLDDIATNAWFRVEGDGANLNILYESDDGATDAAAADSGVDYVDDTWVRLTIDFTNLAAVEFFVDGVSGGTTDMSAAAGNVQIYCEIQKDSGTTTTELEIDYVYLAATRV